MKQQIQKGKIRIALLSFTVAAFLSCLAFLYASEVKEQLWQQSVSTIMENTRQGSTTLRVQLQEEQQSMEVMAAYLNSLSDVQTDKIEEAVSGYRKVNSGISFYLKDGTVYPSGTSVDEEAVRELAGMQAQEGIIDPHINSVTGVKVFNLYSKVILQDGMEGYLLKEYEVDKIVDTFSVSFYNDAGFSYVMDQDGTILIRPPHPNSNKTVQNLFDMFPKERNSQISLQRFRESLKASRTGWATFYYMGEDTVFCYIPLGIGSDWYLISIIPENVVSAQTNEILMRTFLLIGGILLGILLLAAMYFWYISRTNRRLRSQAEYISHLYNAVPEGIALLTPEEPYRFLQLNREGLRLLGYREDSPGSLQEEELHKLICPEDYESTVRVLETTANSGLKNLFECRALRVDGSLFWIAGIVEKTLDETGNPILIATFHDVTAEKLAEEAQEREKRQEHILLVSAISSIYPVIISLNLTRDIMKFIYVQQGLLVRMGDQKTFRELYQGFCSMIHPDNEEEFRRRFDPEYLKQKLGGDRNEVFLEARVMMTDGKYHWTSTQIISVDNPYSDDKLAILISRRIDEQRYEEEQHRQALQSALENAKAASEAKSRFLSNMSHDIRTPMNAIVGMTAIAAAHLDERERVVECLKKISFSSQHLLSLINDILDMSKIESGKFSLRDEPFNLAELVADITDLIRPEADAGRLKIKLIMPVMKNEKVISDPLRIRQVYLNILSNAVKYTAQGGSITVEFREENSRQKGYQNYVFRCTDTGAGMSEEFLQKLYQPFEREAGSAASKTGGTGLGMAITKNIIDLMSGDIHVKSILGKGTVFTVTLPLKLQEAGQDDIPDRWTGVHCLIADDDRQICENTADLLDQLGLHTEFVTEAAAAVRRVVEAKDTPDPFELVILDWKMPDMDGVEATRRIRRVVGPDIPVIILTAYDWSEIEDEARNAGVTAFLSKPFYRSKICYMLNELSGDSKPDETECSAVRPDCTGGRVLLVEDNAMNREIAHVLMEEMGVEVEEACNGAEAVQMVACSPSGYYDLIFMDIQMPVMDGYQATKEIRRLERDDAASIPIVAMTANAFEEDMRAAVRAGMNAHFSKPIDVNALQKLICGYLTGQRDKKNNINEPDSGPAGLGVSG